MGGLWYRSEFQIYSSPPACRSSWSRDAQHLASHPCRDKVRHSILIWWSRKQNYQEHLAKFPEVTEAFLDIMEMPSVIDDSVLALMEPFVEMQHIKRAMYQARLWNQALVSNPQFQSPSDWGWKPSSDG